MEKWFRDVRIGQNRDYHWDSLTEIFPTFVQYLPNVLAAPDFDETFAQYSPFTGSTTTFFPFKTRDTIPTRTKPPFSALNPYAHTHLLFLFSVIISVNAKIY